MTQTSPVITVFSARGCTGKTIIAINLAVALAQAGKRVALVDFDRFADMALMLDIRVARSIGDLAAIDGEITADDLASCIYTHSGVTVLPAPIRPSDWRNVRPEHLERAVELLGQTHDYVVIDTPGTFNDNVARALEMATKVVLVCTPDDKALADTVLAIDLLRSWGFPQDKIHLVLNSNNQASVDSLAVERALGLEVVCSVPYDRSISTPVRLGMPLLISDPKSEAAKSISRLAVGLVAETLEFPTATDQDPTGWERRAAQFAVQFWPDVERSLAQRVELARQRGYSTGARPNSSPGATRAKPMQDGGWPTTRIQARASDRTPNPTDCTVHGASGVTIAIEVALALGGVGFLLMWSFAGLGAAISVAILLPLLLWGALIAFIALSIGWSVLYSVFGLVLPHPNRQMAKNGIEVLLFVGGACIALPFIPVPLWSLEDVMWLWGVGAACLGLAGLVWLAWRGRDREE